MLTLRYYIFKAVFRQEHILLNLEKKRKKKLGKRNAPIVIPAKAGIHLHMREKRQYYIYILASKRNGTLYIGVTNDLKRRIHEHKEKINKGFTSKYNVDRLVYYEIFESIGDAIYREKQLKKWKRNWKIQTIEDFNPCWSDLYDNI